MKNKAFVGLVSLIAISCSLGGAAGWFLGNMFKPAKEEINGVYFDKAVDYSSKPDSFKKVVKALKLDNNKPDFSTLDVSSAIGVDGIKVGDIAETAYHNTFKSDKVMVRTNNLAVSQTPIGPNNQETVSTWIKEKNLYFKENISYSSNAKFAERSYNYDAKTYSPLSKEYENYIDYYRNILDGGIVKRKCDYSTSSTKSTKYLINSNGALDANNKPIKSYSTYFGLSIFKPCNYDYKEDVLLKDSNGNYEAVEIKNSKTGSKTKYISEFKKVDDGYKLTLSLDKTAAANYSSYIKTTTRDASSIAQMKQKPEFKAIGVSFKLDNNLRIISAHSDESYDVISLVGAVDTQCSSDIYFSYDGDYKLPKLNEQIDYGTK